MEHACEEKILTQRRKAAKVMIKDFLCDFAPLRQDLSEERPGVT
jgi:hypothetical protein